MSGRTDDEFVRCLGALNKIRKIGTMLFDQQLWCWGQDIRRAEGNALLAYGFTKHRPPEGKHGSTAYEWRSSGRNRVVLWGFGFFYGDGDRGGLFLQRYKFAMGTPNRQQQLSIFRCLYGNRSNSLNLRSHVMWKRGIAFSACSLKVSHGWATTSGGLFLNTGLIIANGVLTHGRGNVFRHTRWLQSGMNSSNTCLHSLEAIDKHQAQIIIVLNNRPTMYVIGLPNHHTTLECHWVVMNRYIRRSVTHRNKV